MTVPERIPTFFGFMRVIKRDGTMGHVLRADSCLNWSRISVATIMAPVKPARRLARKSATAGPSKSKKPGKLPPKMSKQVKTKPGAQAQKPKKKKPEYSEKQLNLPVLNSIVPANAKTVQKAGGTGKKKNKVFVDDTESMMTILAMVNAEKEGQIEGKVQKERQMEEIREARRKEAEKKEQKRQGKIEKVKQDIKNDQRGKRRRSEADKESPLKEQKNQDKKPKRKSVSFVT
ncbi:60S ribosomal subunit assembly/export protein [Lithohypha guttulata]|uniref:60S ribosomal subunit assembly/export protein n=1 Tax=Lithohypha guttulata TaxID=1690604 RepID=A0AAN7T4J4_9EURO|nr:60S ribosomal subunit assembly/export protein [Lithohypha guttulata]